MKRDKQKQLPHLLAGIIFILVAFYELEFHNLLISIITVVLGSIFLIVAGCHTWLLTKHKDASISFVFLEAVCMFSIAFSFFKGVVPVLFYPLTVIGILYLILVAYFFVSRKKMSRKRYSKKRRSNSAT